MTSTSKFWIATAFALIMSPSLALAGSVPEARVPYSSSAVNLDGRVSDAEWDDAAVISDIRLMGSSKQLRPGTLFHLKHDNKFLFVAVRCFETTPGYPKASRRQPTDLLTDDDAVQVILGTADRLAIAPEVLKIGGYPGTMDEPGPRPDHYYAFTVNSVGSTSRTYNEGVLQRPLFKAAVRQLEGEWPGEWTVEMRIPFASAGIDEPTKEPLYANLIRSRPPDLTGWHLPKFGGYVPMPFAKLHILPAGRESERTDQPPPVKTDQASAEPPLSAKLKWYPLARRVAADVTGPKRIQGATASLRTDGGAAAQAKMSAEGRTRVILDVPNAAQLPAEAELVITTPDGDVLHKETCALASVDRPAWLGTEVAKEYLTDRVPKPWTRPMVTEGAVQLTHSRLSFGSHGLLDSVSGTWGELLAGQSKIVLRKSGRKVRLESATQESSQRGNSVRIDTSLRFDGGTVEVRADVDFDGFTIYKLRVRDLPPREIDGLSVQFPLRKENAKFVHRTHVQSTRGLTGVGWEGKAGPVWVGGQDAGLAFNFDVDPFLSTNRRTQIEVIEEGKQTWLRVNFVDAPGQVADKDHIFQFFLTPTPTKEPSLRKDGFFHTNMGGWFENWSDYQGYPDLAKLPEVKVRTQAARKEGLPFLLYFNMMLAENSPGFARHRSELIIPPGHMWYKREYNPGRGIPCWVCCTRGPYGDLLLDGMSKLANEGDIDGVYMDGTSLAWSCDSLAHGPCSLEELTWEEDRITSLVATRNFVKRIRGIFDAKGKAMLVAHNGGALQIETLSLCDAFYEGEQLSDVRYCRGYRLPMHAAAVCYSGRPWGFRNDVLANMIRPRYMMTYAALHDAEVSGCEELEANIYGDFQDDNTSYHPYWRPQPHVRRKQGDVLCSYYLKPDAAMLIVSNLTWDAQNATLNVQGLFPDESLISAVNVESGERVPISQGRVSLRIPRHRFVALRIEPGAVTNPPTLAQKISSTTATTKPVDRYLPEQWSLNADSPGVTIEHKVDLGKGRRGPKLQSTIHHDVAEASLKAPLGRMRTVRLLVQPSGRFGVRLGETKLVCDGGRITLQGLDPWNDGLVLRPEIRPGVAEELILALNEGVLNASYAGQPLAANVSVVAPKDAAQLSLWTWAGDSLAFDVLEISDKLTRLYEEAGRHPVR
jgi:hypothetical protein